METIVFLQEGGSGGQGGGGIESLVLMIGVIVILYFFMIRPQMKRQKKDKEFRQSIQKGDKVVTAGGIYGRIVSMDEKSVLLSIDEGTKIRIDRNVVARYAGSDQDDKADNKNDKKKTDQNENDSNDNGGKK